MATAKLITSMDRVSLSNQPPASERATCPFADPRLTVDFASGSVRCPFHQHRAPPEPQLKGPVRLALNGGTHVQSQGTAQLLKDIGGGDRIRQMSTRFYAHMFEDKHIRQFLFLDDGAAAHGKRFGDWVVQKMGGEGDVWSDSGRHGMRQPSHHAAWNSARRSPAVRGTHFQLDDCRIWMRLMFWSAREVGLDEHPAFLDWYVQFIGHFVGVYERTAPPYAAESCEWSAEPRNIEKYKRAGNSMDDVIGKRR